MSLPLRKFPPLSVHKMNNSRLSSSALHRWDEVGKSQWFGLKYYVKRLLSLSIVNEVMVLAIRRIHLLRHSVLVSRLPVNRPEVAGRVGDIEFVLTDPMHCCIAKELYWSRGVRRVPADRLALEVFAALAKRSDVVLDIGANTGLFSVIAAAANRSAQVHSYEILSEAADIMTQNVLKNGAEARVRVHRIGIGKAGLTVTLPHLSRFSSVPTSLSTRSRYESGTTVSVESLDDQIWVAEGAASVLIKIDVEGTEDEILENGRKFLQSFRPYILCEVLPSQLRANAISDLLRSLNYRMYLIRDRSPAPSADLRPDIEFHDWLFVPDSEAESALSALDEAGISVSTCTECS